MIEERIEELEERVAHLEEALVKLHLAHWVRKTVGDFDYGRPQLTALLPDRPPIRTKENS
jgi:uncharacterized coiled-coil protein SlyX